MYELLLKPHQLAAATETAADLPDARFVLDHLAKPLIADGVLEPWRSDLRALARHPNVACKLSGMVTEADWAKWTVDALRPYADAALEAFGPDRLLFGSDWPVLLLASTYGGWMSAAEELTADLSPDERAAVFGGNARRIYQI